MSLTRTPTAPLLEQHRPRRLHQLRSPALSGPLRRIALNDIRRIGMKAPLTRADRRAYSSNVIQRIDRGQRSRSWPSRSRPSRSPAAALELGIEGSGTAGVQTVPAAEPRRASSRSPSGRSTSTRARTAPSPSSRTRPASTSSGSRRSTTTPSSSPRSSRCSTEGESGGRDMITLSDWLAREDVRPGLHLRSSTTGEAAERREEPASRRCGIRPRTRIATSPFPGRPG